jgi:D-threo-aldose 1-dehydrogenase
VDPFVRRRLGCSDVHVTPLGFGGAALGNLYRPVSEETARATVERAICLGVAHFDTAPYYGYGLSEERLGRALPSDRRSEWTVSSKVGRLLVPRAGAPREDQGFVDAHAFDPVFDYGYDGVMRSFESSLARLRVDRIDVLLLHDVGAMTHGDRHPEVFETAMQGGYRALTELRDAGVVGAIGLGVNETAVCIEALERVQLDCLLLAGRYTLLEQAPLDDLLPRCEERSTSLIVGGPFNSGILVEPRGGASHYDYAEPPTAIRTRVDRLAAVCARYDVPLAAVALQLPLHHPAVAAVIPGGRSPQEVEAHAHWVGLDIPGALYEELREEGLVDPRTPTGSARA